MIGARAFLVDMVFPFIWALIALAVAAVFLKSKKSTSQVSQSIASKSGIRGVMFVVVLALGLGNGAFWLVRQLQNRSALRDLTTDSVAAIQVGEIRLDQSPQVSFVVDALRESRWYVHTAGDGGWGKAVSLVIRFKSGGERRYRVSRMLKHEGAVIDFIGQNPNSQFIGHYGYAWSKSLPSALDHIGISLPIEVSDRR